MTDVAQIEAKPTVRVLRAELPDAVLEVHDAYGDLKVVVDAERIVDVMTLLKTHAELEFDYLMDIASVDHIGETPRFELVYILYSTAKKKRVRVHTRLPEKNSTIDSVVTLWKGANWFEREAWDMMGVRFRGHPNLRRILTHPEFVGHPLRKDYEASKRHLLSRNYDLYDRADSEADPPGEEDE